MARKIMLEVTQPYHASGTEVAYQPGHLFDPGADLPEGIRVREVIADVPDEPAEPAAGQDPAPAKAPAKTAAAKAR